MESNMFCYQCQETAGCTGCTRVGVCGKQPEVAALQDLLVYVTKGMSAVTTQLRAEGTPVDPETNHWVTLNLFLTITNANLTAPPSAPVCRIPWTGRPSCLPRSRTPPAFPRQLTGPASGCLCRQGRQGRGSVHPG